MVRPYCQEECFLDNMAATKNCFVKNFVTTVDYGVLYLKGEFFNSSELNGPRFRLGNTKVLHKNYLAIKENFSTGLELPMNPAPKNSPENVENISKF